MTDIADTVALVVGWVFIAALAGSAAFIATLTTIVDQNFPLAKACLIGLLTFAVVITMGEIT